MIKRFKDFLTENNDVKDLDQLRPMSKWIESVWSKLEDKDDAFLSNFFNEVEDCCGKEVSDIIDSMYSDDKLHYHQNGDTQHFIENFEEIKDKVEKILTK